MLAQETEPGVEAPGHVHPHHEATVNPHAVAQAVAVTQHRQALEARRDGRPEELFE